MGRLYWIVAAVLVAIVVHAGFILMVPALSFERSVARLSADSGANAFFILPQQEQSDLFPAYPRHSVVGICAFDVTSEQVQLTASMPDGFWTLTIYSNRGDVIYAVNNAQTGTNSFTVGLSRAPDIIEMLRQSTVKEAIGDDTGWNVESPAPRGLAVMWYPVSEGAARAAVVEKMSATTCKPVPQPAI